MEKVMALLNFKTKVSSITLAYITKLGLGSRLINVNIEKIDNLILETYDMTLASFLLQDSLEKIQFFKKTFLLANTHMKMILGMLFLLFSNTDVKFIEQPEKLT